jgi:hypothetical protein
VGHPKVLKAAVFDIISQDLEYGAVAAGAEIIAEPYPLMSRRGGAIRFLVFKPPLTRCCLHHFYLFPYLHLLQPFLVSAHVPGVIPLATF